MLLALLMLAVVLALALSACGGGSSSSSSSSSTSTTETEPSEEAGTEEGGGEEAGEESGGSVVAEAESAVAEAEEEPTEIASAGLGAFKPEGSGTIYFVSCDPAIEGCSQIKKGVEAATKAIGYKFEGCDQRSSDPESGPQCFTNAVNAKPDVIIENGLSAEGAGSGYADAEKAGIPLISMFSGNKPGAATVSVAEGDFCQETGEAQAAWSIASTGGKTNAIIPFTNEFVCTTQAKEGLEAGLEKCSECQAKAFEINVATATTSLPQQIQAELLGNPDVNAVLGTFNLPPTIAAEVVEQLGRTDVQIGGMFGGAPNLEMIKAGGPQESESTNGSGEPGWVAVDAAARLMVGEKLPDNLPVTWMTLTTKNVGNFPKGYLGASGYEKQFEELWAG
jgi:ABC-type sugar transport system substrate-binding protein